MARVANGIITLKNRKLSPSRNLSSSYWHEAANPKCPLTGPLFGVKRKTFPQREPYRF
jgi:hypothetical protein